jgi:adenylate cyclase
MQARPGHILVVDDDALNRSLLIKNLEHAGHRASAAENGFAAFEGLEADPPDVVLLDIEMPGIDGIEVLERLKADEAFRHIPVIMISGVDDTDAIVRCLGAGACAPSSRTASGRCSHGSCRNRSRGRCSPRAMVSR